MVATIIIGVALAAYLTWVVVRTLRRKGGSCGCGCGCGGCAGCGQQAPKQPGDPGKHA